MQLAHSALLTTNSPSRTRTYDLAVNRKSSKTCRKAQKSIIFSILASFYIFARVRILSRFFASYSGICSAKRYKTVVVFLRFAAQQDQGRLAATSLPHILSLWQFCSPFSGLFWLVLGCSVIRPYFVAVRISEAFSASTSDFLRHFDSFRLIDTTIACLLT